MVCVCEEGAGGGEGGAAPRACASPHQVGPVPTRSGPDLNLRRLHARGLEPSPDPNTPTALACHALPASDDGKQQPGQRGFKIPGREPKPSRRGDAAEAQAHPRVLHRVLLLHVLLLSSATQRALLAART